MPKAKAAEKWILRIEGFAVQFVGDRPTVGRYEFKRPATGEMTVDEWRSRRFSMSYPEHEVRVFDGAGNEVSGDTTLQSVRDSYTSE